MDNKGYYLSTRIGKYRIYKVNSYIDKITLDGNCLMYHSSSEEDKLKFEYELWIDDDGNQHVSYKLSTC